MITRASFLETTERSPGRIFAALGLLFVLAYLSSFTIGTGGRRPINGDAIQYYAYLRSVVFDRDLDFTNDYAVLYGTSDPASNVWLRERTATGLPQNQMSVGPALLWSPFYLVVSATLVLMRALGAGNGADGFSLPFQLVPGVAGILYATMGAYLCFRVAALRFSTRAALWGTLTAWLASPAIYYSLISPSYSHAVSLFAVALFVLVWLGDVDRISVARFAALGVIGGLATLVRWQDIVVLALPVMDLARAAANRRPIRQLLPAAVALAVTLMVSVLPQLFAWRTLYGSYLSMPQGAGFMRWTDPAVLSVLLSRHHGLWLWTPAVMMATLGLLLVYRRDRYVGSAITAVFVVTVYINAAVSDWWAGEAFGARRFIGDTVIFALGLGALFAWMETRWSRRAPRIAATVLIVYNLLFVLQYSLFMRGHRDLVPYPQTLRQILVDRVLLPYDLLHAWLAD